MESKIQEFLNTSKKVFSTDTHPYLETWLSTCSMNELKGLKVISSVIKHKGKKKFRPVNFESSPSVTQNLRTRTMTSFYKSDYCSPASPVNKNLFDYAKLSDMRYAELLSYESLIYLQNWLDLKDNQKYSNYLLECLKGLFSVISAAKDSFLTTNKMLFSRFVNEKLQRTPQNVVQKEFNWDRRQNSALRARPIKSENKLISKSTNLNKYNPQFYDSRMKSIMKGTDGILRWVSEKNTSTYHETFIEKFGKTQTIKPLLSSTVVKIIP